MTQWTEIGTEEMKRAQERTGLSDEKLAAHLHISAKTWSRWKKRGAIPTHDLQRVAPVLGFALVALDPIEIPVEPPPGALVATPGLQEGVATLVDLVLRLAETAERCEATLDRIEQAIGGLGRSRRQAQPRR